MNFYPRAARLLSGMAFNAFNEGSEEAAVDALLSLDAPATEETTDDTVSGQPEEGEVKPQDGVVEGEPDDEEADGAGEGEPEEGSEAEGGDEEQSDGAAPDAAKPDPFSGIADDATVTIGDQKVRFGELKALAGQATALHAAGQQLIEQRAQVNQIREAHLAGLKAVQQGAQARWDELAKMDIASYRANASPEEFKQFSAYADKTLAELNAANQAVQGLEPEVTQAQQAARAEALQSCAKALLDPATGIPGYNQEAHEANIKFAKSMGLNDSALDGLTDPAAWKIINLAAQKAKADTAIASKIAPKKAIRSATPANKGTSSAGKGNSGALARLQRTGSADDAISALLELDANK